MGQAITVTEKPTARPGVVRFELNRSLTGMGHRRYRSLADVQDDKTADRLARLLLGRDGVQAVHVYSNEVTVEVAPGSSTGGLAEAIADLFIHYREGVTPSLP